MFESVNLERELTRIKAKGTDEGQNIVDRFKSLFQADWERELEIAGAVASSHKGSRTMPVSELLDTERFFKEGDIQKLALRFRLRFLPTKYFNGELPAEALHRVRSLESKLDIRIENFHLLAPSKVFKLGDVNVDPLLFAQMTDGRYYLIHKWGSDLAWHRRISALPFRHPLYLLATVVFLSFLLAAITPTDFFRSGASYLGWERAALFVWNSIFLAGVGSFMWFASNRQFSSDSWKSPYFN